MSARNTKKLGSLKTGERFQWLPGDEDEGMEFEVLETGPRPLVVCTNSDMEITPTFRYLASEMVEVIA